MASSSPSSSSPSHLFPMPTSHREAPQTPESFDSLRRRSMAAEILQSYEKLSWMSAQRCESITQTRRYFRGLVAGLLPDDEDAAVRWKEDFTPHPPKPGEEPKRSSKKGKERVSLEGAAEGSGRGEASDRKRKGKERKSEGGSAAMGSGAVH